MVVSYSGAAFSAPARTPEKSSEKNREKPSEKAKGQFETHRDLIQKAQNLTLQRDRLQTSQVLIRGLQRESRNSQAYKELAKALDDLTSVFYTDKAQTAFVAGDSIIESKPREAIDRFLEAQRLEESNVSTLKSLARAYLILEECGKADPAIRSAEALNPYSPEIKLLRLQYLDCSKSHEAFRTQLAAFAPELDPMEKFARGMMIRDLLRRDELKKARTLLATWETQNPDYPEVQYWKWEISRNGGSVDRQAAIQYVQTCQNMTPRRRKSYILDVDLCKGKVTVETFLKETGLRSATPAEGPDDD